MKRARPLDRFLVFDTCDLDETRAVLAHAYARPALELVGRNRTFRAIVNRCELQHIGLNYGSYAASMRMQFPATEFASQIFSIREKHEALTRGTAVTVSSDCSVVVSPGEVLSITNNAESERLLLMINSAALTNKLSAITGESCSKPLKFNPIQNYALRTAKALHDHLFFLVDKLSTFAMPLPNLVLAEFEQTIMVMFLHANQHNYSHLLQQTTASDVAPWQIRRTEEYIEANWQHSITLEDLTEVTGVSALGLFRSFKKSRGYSPMEFANRVRLSHARELLRRPDAATSVAEVAVTCGFADLDRFDRDYARAFSELPSATLSRGNSINLVRH